MRGDMLIRQAMSVGLHFSISLERGVTIKVDPDIVRRWAPLLRPHKAELIQRLPATDRRLECEKMESFLGA